MIYLLSFIIVIGLPVFLHELGHFLAARSVGIKVEKFYIGFNLFGLGYKKQYKGTEYGIGLFPLGGYVKVAGILDESMDSKIELKNYEFRAKNTFEKIWFLSAGVLMNFILSTIIFSIFNFVNGIPKIIDEPIIKNVVEKINEKGDLSPAFISDLQPGDEIIFIDNINVNSWTDLSEIIHNHPEKYINVQWKRENQYHEKNILTSSTSIFENGEFKEIGILGISPDYTILEIGFFEAIISGCKQTVSWIRLMFSSLKSLMSGNVSFDQMSGPLGIANIAGETAQSGGIAALMMLMGIISINLGIINILPIPGLDGGHVFIALIEGVIQRELPMNIKYGIQTFGFFLLMSLFVLVFYNDIINLI